ncbi:MAG: hypothetical protein ABSF60_08640 [Verrucomicrobiota bacterium]
MLQSIIVQRAFVKITPQEDVIQRRRRGRIPSQCNAVLVCVLDYHQTIGRGRRDEIGRVQTLLIVLKECPAIAHRVGIGIKSKMAEIHQFPPIRQTAAVTGIVGVQIHQKWRALRKGTGLSPHIQAAIGGRNHGTGSPARDGRHIGNAGQHKGNSRTCATIAQLIPPIVSPNPQATGLVQKKIMELTTGDGDDVAQT